MRKNIIWLLTVSCLLTGCAKDGDIICLPTPDEEHPSTAPLVTVIYGPNGLGDRSYNDLIYKGEGQQPFLWSLTETDVSLSELVMSYYADYLKWSVINKIL